MIYLAVSASDVIYRILFPNAHEHEATLSAALPGAGIMTTLVFVT